MRKLSLALVVAVLSVSLSAAAVSASATVAHFTYELQLAGQQIEGCTEFVEFTSGVSIVQTTGVEDGNGGIHSSVHAHLRDVAGVGLDSGTEYHLRGSSSSGFFITGENEDRTGYIEDHLVLVAKGKAPNLLLRTRSHYTIDSAGNLRVGYFEAEAICR